MAVKPCPDCGRNTGIMRNRDQFYRHLCTGGVYNSPMVPAPPAPPKRDQVTIMVQIHHSDGGMRYTIPLAEARNIHRQLGDLLEMLAAW